MPGHGPRSASVLPPPEFGRGRLKPGLQAGVAVGSIAARASRRRNRTPQVTATISTQSHQPKIPRNQTTASGFQATMLHKLGLRDRTQLVIAAYESGFVWAAPR